MTWTDPAAAELDALAAAQNPRQGARKGGPRGPWEEARRQRLEATAAAMRSRYLWTGTGCAAQRRAIAARLSAGKVPST